MILLWKLPLHSITHLGMYDSNEYKAVESLYRIFPSKPQLKTVKISEGWAVVEGSGKKIFIAPQEGTKRPIISTGDFEFVARGLEREGKPRETELTDDGVFEKGSLCPGKWRNEKESFGKPR